jgi:hypothetical protein
MAFMFLKTVLHGTVRLWTKGHEGFFFFVLQIPLLSNCINVNMSYNSKSACAKLNSVEELSCELILLYFEYFDIL